MALYDGAPRASRRLLLSCNPLLMLLSAAFVLGHLAYNIGARLANYEKEAHVLKSIAATRPSAYALNVL